MIQNGPERVFTGDQIKGLSEQLGLVHDDLPKKPWFGQDLRIHNRNVRAQQLAVRTVQGFLEELLNYDSAKGIVELTLPGRGKIPLEVTPLMRSIPTQGDLGDLQNIRG